MANGQLSVQDVFTRVQRTFGDESSVQVQLADVVRWINDAQREAVMQHENLLQTSALLDVVALQQTYDLPEDCFTINSIYYRDSDDSSASYYGLAFMSIAELNQLASGWQGSDYGSNIPQIYTRGNADGTFTLFPAPGNSRTNGLQVTYARYAVDVVDTTSTIDLPAYYHSMVEAFCMMKAYEMDEDWPSVTVKAQYVQSTIDANSAREQWFGHETYPSITTKYQDY